MKKRRRRYYEDVNDLGDFAADIAEQPIEDIETTEEKS
jgi:hypothetical protein